MEYIDRIKDKPWSTWTTEEINNKEYEQIINNLEFLYQNTQDSECLWLLSELCIHKSNSLKRNGLGYAKKGLSLAFDKPGLHDNHTVCSNGILPDFTKRNHHKLISFYYDFIAKYPESIIAKRIIIEHLIDNYRLTEATEIIESIKERTFFFEFYKGQILYLQGKHEQAIALWEKTCTEHSENYICYFLYADQLARFARYEKALEYYEKSFQLQQKPRRIDSLIASWQIHEIQKNYQKALEILDLIITVYEQDYEVFQNDDEVLEYIQEKERLSKVTE